MAEQGATVKEKWLRFTIARKSHFQNSNEKSLIPNWRHRRRHEDFSCEAQQRRGSRGEFDPQTERGSVSRAPLSLSLPLDPYYKGNL